MKEIIKYVFAGLVNTVTGYLVFLMLYRWLKWTPESANTMGYFVALFMAFMLNHYFVFSATALTFPTASRFIVAFIIAFMLNQAVLFFFIQILSVNPEIAQIFSMLAYSITFYFLNKYYVFFKLKACYDKFE